MAFTPGSVFNISYRLLRRFGWQSALDGDWSLGVVRDLDRAIIPRGGLYDAQDMLVDQSGLLRERGGWGYQSVTLSGEDNLVGIAAPEFPGDGSAPRVIAFASDGSSTHLYDITDPVTPGAGIDTNDLAMIENPSLYVDKLIICDGDQVYGGSSHAVQKAYLSTGTVTVGDLGGSPPVASFSTVHLQYLVLGRDEATPNRIWFSPEASIEDTWDTTTRIIDVAEPITGLASVQGVLLIFSRGRCWRVLGNIPPGTVGANMSLQPLANTGCVDARTIVTIDNQVYFANESGVYRTNGAAVESITTKRDGTGIGTLWQSTLAGFAPALGEVVCAGVYRNQWLFLSVTHSSDLRVTFLCYLPRLSWVQLTNSCCDMYATRFAPSAELYGAGSPAKGPQALTFSGIFEHGSGNASDADGTAVAGAFTTRGLTPGSMLKSYGHAHLTYDLRSPCGAAAGMTADASAADAYVGKDLGADYSDVWVTVGLTIPDADALADFVASSPYFVGLWDPTNTIFSDYVRLADASNWQGGWGSGAPVPTVGRHLVELRHVKNGNSTMYVDGTLVYDFTPESSGVDTRFVTVGLANATVDPASRLYVDSVKVGTVRGGSDVFSDDFSSGDLSKWTSTVGTVTVCAPTVAIEALAGMEASESQTPEQSPLAATADSTRKRFDVNRDSANMSLAFTRTGAASKFEVRALEVQTRGYQGEDEGE